MPTSPSLPAWHRHRARLAWRRGRHGVANERCRRDAEHLGHLVMRHVKVVLQDEDGSLLGRQSSEPALQLITIVDRWIRVGVGGTIGQRSRRSLPTAAAVLGICGMNQEPVRPGFEPIRVAERRKMTPDGDQRLLCRVLGARAVPQDAVGDRVQADRRRGRQAGRRRHDRPAAPGSPADAPRSCLNAVPGWVRSTLYESQGASVNRKSDSAGLDWRPHVASSASRGR